MDAANFIYEIFIQMGIGFMVLGFVIIFIAVALLIKSIKNEEKNQKPPGGLPPG